MIEPLHRGSALLALPVQRRPWHHVRGRACELVIVGTLEFTRPFTRPLEPGRVPT